MYVASTTRTCASLTTYKSSCVPAFVKLTPARQTSVHQSVTCLPLRSTRRRAHVPQECRATLASTLQVSDQLSNRLCPNLVCCTPCAIQTLFQTASQPHPGLACGALVNSTVYILGLQVLLKGTERSCQMQLGSATSQDHLTSC